MLTRRRFITIGTAAGLGTLAGCRSDGREVSTATATTIRPQGTVPPGTPADVVARYAAGPMRWQIGDRPVDTWGYDGTLPGRLLRSRAGGLVEVTLVNELAESTSVHWHGLAITNAMDGVPGVTQPDIAPGEEFVYRFVTPHPGTYWFHPHHGLQLEHGLYAPLIVDDPDEHVAYDIEYVVVLDDWLDGTGSSPQAEFERIREAAAVMGDMAGMDHSSMGSMNMATSPLLGGDAGDVSHPYHLINGRPLDDPATLEPLPRAGDRVRIRVINASGDTAYRFAIGGHRLTVTHTDGFPVEPVEVDAFLIGMGERYDVTFTAESGTWPLVALAEGKGERAGAILRTSDAAAGAELRFEAAQLDGKWLRYADLAAHDKARLEPPADLTPITLELTGSMMQASWGINGRAYGDHEPTVVEAGNWYALTITNASDMWHPLHIHGHTPQIGRAAGGVRKDTVNILPGASTELVFRADNPGTWMLHCHNAYHLEAGMASLITYASPTPVNDVGRDTVPQPER